MTTTKSRKNARDPKPSTQDPDSLAETIKIVRAMTDALTHHTLTRGGKDPEGAAKEKILEIAELSKADKSTITHSYSSAYNKNAKFVRFYIHVTKIGEQPPVLWLSRNQYKTCRNGHKYFFISTMTARDGKHEARWRNMTFNVDGDKVLVHSVNDTDDHDMWSFIGARSSKTETLSLFTR